MIFCCANQESPSSSILGRFAPVVQVFYLQVDDLVTDTIRTPRIISDIRKEWERNSLRGFTLKIQQVLRTYARVDRGDTLMRQPGVSILVYLRRVPSSCPLNVQVLQLQECQIVTDTGRTVRIIADIGKEWEINNLRGCSLIDLSNISFLLISGFGRIVQMNHIIASTVRRKSLNRIHGRIRSAELTFGRFGRQAPVPKETD